MSNLYSVSQKPYHIAIADRILDSVHGQIGLTPVEREIERLPIFKRLHNISQLGLVNRIFPCAVHTRYSHSLGVMHVAALMTESINGKFRVPFFSDDDIQVIRLAGLLHDIGHYPMSHNVEMVYKSDFETKDPVKKQLDTYVNCPKMLYPEKIASKPSSFLEDYCGSAKDLHHERMGQRIITHNADLFDKVKYNYVLMYDDEESKTRKLNPFFSYKKATKRKKEITYTEKEVDDIVRSVMATIGAIVIGNYAFQDEQLTEDIKHYPFDKYSAMVQLIHSELDADNIDYLLRDASFSGTSYGTMDMSLLISALTVSKMSYEYTSDNSVQYKGIKYLVGIQKKRIGCVEQFLMSKYMAYSQVVFSKYVSILEAMLFRVSIKLFDDHNSPYAKNNLTKLVETSKTSSQFLDFNDSYIFHRIRTFKDSMGGYAPPSPDNEMFIQINNNLAFYVDKEVSSVSLDKKQLIKSIKNTSLYKEFCKVYRELGDDTESVLQSNGKLTKLLSFRFETYSLTKQLPYDIFLQKYPTDVSTPSLSYKSHYYRLANGIPVLEESEYLFNEDSPDHKLPQLVVDLESSLLHEIYPLCFVYLRKYIIDNEETAS